MSSSQPKDCRWSKPIILASAIAIAALSATGSAILFFARESHLADRLGSSDCQSSVESCEAGGVSASLTESTVNERALKSPLHSTGRALLQSSKSTNVLKAPPEVGASMELPPADKHVIVPVPLYMHKKPAAEPPGCIGANGSNPFLGDPLERRCGAVLAPDAPAAAAIPSSGMGPEPDKGPPAAVAAPTEGVEAEGEMEREGKEQAEGGEEHGGHAEHSQGHTVILLLFIVLLLGILTSHILERHLPFVPYTAALFLWGLFISLFQNWKRLYDLVIWPSFDTAVAIWEKADPHLMLFIFLPPLIFGDAMSLNVSLVRRCSKQCLLLAGPGVLIGAAMTGWCAKYIFPYGWDWNTSMLFGSILSATDPVAVVAIFNSLGVSPRLTMVISGESLFNDGTAYVVFILCLGLCQGVPFYWSDVLGFFFRMTTLGPLIGYALAHATIWFIGLSTDSHYHGDTMGQFVATLCCAYLAFFLSEEMRTSGVLALVIAGLVVASHAWPRFIARGTLHTIWHAIEFVGNTVIFVLAGLMFGGIIIERRDIIEIKDWFLLALLYCLCTVIRALMIAILWIPLNKLGHPVTPQEGAVAVWAGMRGAVGLLMAVIADRDPFISREAGTRIMFHMGGMAALMLLVNGPFTPLVLRVCGLMESTDKEEAIEDVKRKVAARTKLQLPEEMKSEEHKHMFSHADEDEVLKLLPELAEVGLTEHPTDGSHTEKLEQQYQEQGVNMQHVRMLRESMLRVVQACYWELCDEGVLPRKTIATKVLLDACDLGMLDSSSEDGLRDWDVIKEQLKLGEYETEEEFNNTFHLFEDFWRYQQRGIITALAFMHAHNKALKEVRGFCSSDCPETYEERQVYREVQNQIDKAAAFLEGCPSSEVAFAQNKMMARKLLKFQAHQVKTLAKRGLITDMVGGEVEHSLHHQSQDLMNLKSVTGAVGAPFRFVGGAAIAAGAQAGGAAAAVGRALGTVIPGTSSQKPTPRGSTPTSGPTDSAAASQDVQKL